MNIFMPRFPFCHCDDCERYMAKLGIKSDTPIEKVFCILRDHMEKKENAERFRSCKGHEYLDGSCIYCGMKCY